MTTVSQEAGCDLPRALMFRQEPQHILALPFIADCSFTGALWGQISHLRPTEVQQHIFYVLIFISSSFSKLVEQDKQSKCRSSESLISSPSIIVSSQLKHQLLITCQLRRALFYFCSLFFWRS